MKKPGNYITKAALIRFKKWLVVEDLTVNKFAQRCGVSRQYVERALKGEIKITDTVRNHFKDGGYELL